MNWYLVVLVACSDLHNVARSGIDCRRFKILYTEPQRGEEDVEK